MRVLYLYCHPVPESFHGAIHAAGLAALRGAGHEVDDCDLYAEGFDPVLRTEERRRYHDLSRNREGVESYVERLQRAEGLVVQFPTWCFGPPAMVKGFFDRLFIPGVAFDLSDPTQVRSCLPGLRRITGISSYGQGRLPAFWMGDPSRHLVTRYLRWYAAKGAPVRYLAQYNMNTVDRLTRERFIGRVADVLRTA